MGINRDFSGWAILDVTMCVSSCSTASDKVKRSRVPESEGLHNLIFDLLLVMV